MREPVIAVVYNIPRSKDNPFAQSSLDVLNQVEEVENSLAVRGLEVQRIAFTRDCETFLREIRRRGISVIVNLCETVDEDSRFAGHPAALFELLGIPFTGSPSFAITNSTDKATAKLLLKGAGVSTPGYVFYDGVRPFRGEALSYPVIVKPCYEDASNGIDQDAVCRDERAVLDCLEERYSLFGPLLVEEFIDGREFNVSLLGYPRPEVLPLAEIDFSGLPSDLHSIVGYRAKWDSESVEYRCTNRIFPKLPTAVAGELRRVALESFTLFGLRDYGRVDIRMDTAGRIFVLEVNANPGIASDAGFAAAAAQSGVTHVEMIEKLVHCACERAINNDQETC